MNAKLRRLLTWTVAAVVLLALLYLALRPQPHLADFAAVERGRLEVTLDEEGETRVRDRFVVSAPVAGKVLRIELEPGDAVRAGESELAILAPADPTPLDVRSRAEAEARVSSARAALAQAQAERGRAEANLDFATAERRRMERLAEASLISRQAAEQAELEARRAERELSAADSGVESARFELSAARAALVEAGGGRRARSEAIVLRAPVDGLVLRRLRESESVVAAGEPLLEIGDPADLEVVSDFLSSDAVQVRPGDAVRIERWGGPAALDGRVRRVEPSGFTKISALGVEEQRVNLIIDLEDPPERRAGLADGFRVEVRVVVWEGHDLLHVPISSLFRHGEGPGDEWALFVVDGDRARLRPVEVGRRNDRRAEIRSGVEEGQTVIVHPGETIADGTLVAQRQSDAGAG